MRRGIVARLARCSHIARRRAPSHDAQACGQIDSIRKGRALALTLLVALALAGCFESDEERALAAYADHDYSTARQLAATISEVGNPRGHELLALMDAQGLGGSIDFAAAFGYVELAIALDPSYETSRATIEDYAERTALSAQAAFDAGEFERARALAAPLAAIGHDGGAALTNRLITGGYVVLDGSAMSWRTFLDLCSGNTRNESAADPDADFAANCQGREAVWDGVVVNLKERTLHLKMDPGRERAHQDLMVDLAETAEAALAVRGSEIRFHGVIGERGDASRPDRLVEARILGPGLRTPEEEAREVALEHQAVIGACRRLINEAFRGSHAPQWTHELRARLTAGQRRRLRFYSFIALDAPPLAFAGDRDQGYRARLSGHATIQAHNDQTASDQDFVVDCRVEGDHRGKSRGESLGSITFESLSEPNFDG